MSGRRNGRKHEPLQAFVPPLVFAASRLEVLVKAEDLLIGLHAYTGLGVLSDTLLDEVGASKEAKWILAEGADGAHMSRSIPMEKALDDALIVYAQNGEALRPEQGYPVRLINIYRLLNSADNMIARLEILFCIYTKQRTGMTSDKRNPWHTVCFLAANRTKHSFFTCH